MFYYKYLPEGYTLKKEVDAKNKKTALIFNGIALVILLAVIILIYFFRLRHLGQINFDESLTILLYLLIYMVFMIAYVVIHELTHGLFYKIFTKQKLKFGFNLSVAYCGVPEGYVAKVPALITVLAPLVLHSIWMITLVCTLNDFYWNFVISLLLAAHLSGCVGDCYVSFLLIKYPKDVLVNDDGAKQTFYCKEVNETTSSVN